MTITIENIIELINGLNDPTLNKHYENKLQEITNEIGFGVLLAQIASDNKFEFIHRQFSGILLKKYISQHWDVFTVDDDDDEDQDPDQVDYLNDSTITQEEKNQLLLFKQQQKEKEKELKKYRVATIEEKSQIKKLLSPCLSDPSSKIRTAIAMCIAKIGVYEWPHDWPELVDELIVCLKQASNNTTSGGTGTGTGTGTGNNDLLHGVIRCLEILCDPSDGLLSDEQIESLIKLVYPVFTELLARDMGDPMIHIRIINVFRNTITHITFMKGVAKGLTKAIIPFIDSWIPTFISHLSRILDINSPFINHHFTINSAIIEIFTMLINDFPKRTSKHVQSILSPIWTLFNSCFPIYDKCEINPTHGIVSNFVEEGITKIDRLVSSIFDFMAQIVDSDTLSPLFKPFLKPIFSTSIHYMQMPMELVDLWDSDSNLFLETEDENTYTPRVVATTLVQNMCIVYKKEGAENLFASISEVLVKANQEKSAQNKSWWKLREAALLALCNSSAELVKHNKQQFNVASFLSTNLAQDFNIPLEQADEESDHFQQGSLVLRGRSLICASKFAKLVDANISLPFFKQSVLLLTPTDIPTSLKLSAVMAIGSFAPKIPHESIVEFIPASVQTLVAMVTQLSEDSLLLVLECIIMLIKIDKDITGSLEPILTPHLSQAWINYSNDPSLCDALKQIFQVICACPKSYPGVLQRMIPTLNIILCAYDNPIYTDTIADSAVDILSLLMARVDQQFDSFLLDQLFAPILNILLNCDDRKHRTILKASVSCLLPFVYKIPSDLLIKWNFTPVAASTSESSTTTTATPINGLHALFLVIKRILFADELIRIEIPSILNAILIKHSEIIGSQMTPLFQSILEAFYNSKLPTTKTAFSSVFARLIVQHKSTIIDYLAGIPGPNGKGSALVFVLNEWQKYHFEFRSKLENNVSIVAMCTLVGLNDPRLDSITIDGTQIVPDSKSTSSTTAAGLRRKKAQYSGSLDKWTTVPLFHKVFLNLLETIRLESEELSKAPNSKPQDHNDSDEDFDDDHVEDDSDDEDQDLTSKKYPNVDEHGFAPAEDYSDMIDYAQDGDEDENLAQYLSDEFSDDTFDIISKSDPLYHIELLKYLSNFFTNLKSTSSSIFEQVAPLLNEFKVSQNFN